MGTNDVNARRMGSVLDAGTVAVAQLNKLLRRLQNLCLTYPTIANGSTTGKLKTTSAISYLNDGALLTKGATDDLWDFTGETDVAASAYAAYALLLDGGTASILKHGSTDKTTAQAALDALEKLLYTSAYIGDCVVGVFVTDGTAKDWDGEAMASGGTIYQGWPESLRLGEIAFV